MTLQQIRARLENMEQHGAIVSSWSVEDTRLLLDTIGRLILMLDRAYYRDYASADEMTAELNELGLTWADAIEEEGDE